MTTDKYCDCAQGRWPCTCMPRYVGKRPELGMPYGEIPEAIRLDAHKLMADGVDAYLAGRAGAPDPYKVAAEAIRKQQGVSAEGLRHLRNGGRVSFADGKETLLPPDVVGPTIVDLIEQGYLSPYDAKVNRPGYWERLATDKAKLFALKCAEFDALNARLQVYRGVALIGWAGSILVLLGV